MAGRMLIDILSAKLERDLISLRTKEALAAKKRQGIRLGKPKGAIQKVSLTKIGSGSKSYSN
ncbi:hypothetical protein KDI_10920 [Dictyobacter arantiisoli]|uniref:Resolvase/invertase-type recombinase catalytic domain-containing protein n=1 Tax=Dictyobacter arantiisoli TaxID=2014874 RepID=A0A5A5T805_9CHLR|nr:hypothetical protein KDI_10920 [Dictyobacter arantiisoli]